MYKLVIVALGAFGAAVSERLNGPDAWIWQGEPFDIDVSRLPLADSYVMVVGHPCPQLEIHLCQAVLNWRRRFIPVVHEHPYLRSGPVTYVGALACSACYDRRIHQHTASNEVSDRMADEYLRRGDAALPRGILPVWADVASGLATLRLAQGPEAGPQVARQMLGVDLVSGGVVRAEVIGVDGCRVCGRIEGDPLDRSIVNLSSILSAMMSGAHDGID
ncbi:hypothetical protein [Propionibacterium acidifaciens]|nr:hypothetical protein [Propionibacterium acidifaciens]